MKKIITTLAFCGSVFTALTTFGQVIEKPNIIKFNLTGPVVGYYTLGYEHVINIKQSTGVTISVAPNVDLPFKSTLLNIFGDNDEAVTAINSTQFTSFSIMPEYHFYTGPLGSPVGIYFATFIKYTHMTHEQQYQFTGSSGKVHAPTIETTFNGIGAGELIGVQWRLGKSMTLDWWIVGPFAGVLTGKSHGVDDLSDMDAEDKANLETDIESVPIPTWKIDATVGQDVIDAEFKGVFYGARIFGLNLGYRF